jgi:hypothetical protein
MLRALLVVGIIAPLAAAVVWWTADPDWFRSTSHAQSGTETRAEAATATADDLHAGQRIAVKSSHGEVPVVAASSKEFGVAHTNSRHEVVPVALHFEGPPTPRQSAGTASMPQEPPILLIPADEVRERPRAELDPSTSVAPQIGDAATSPSAEPSDDTQSAIRRLPPVIKRLPSPEASVRVAPQVASDAPSTSADAGFSVESSEPARDGAAQRDGATKRDEPELELQPAHAAPWMPLRRLPPVESPGSPPSAPHAPAEEAPVEPVPAEPVPDEPVPAESVPDEPNPAELVPSEALPANVAADAEPETEADEEVDGGTLRMAPRPNAHGWRNSAPPAIPETSGNQERPFDDATDKAVLATPDAVAPLDITARDAAARDATARDAAAARAASIAADRAMQGVRQQANDHLRSGLAVASRGAFYSGRADFIQALRVLAQALDAQSRKRSHSESLARGLIALEEADDFVPKGSALEAELNVASIVSAHRTPVLKESKPSPTPLEALQAYYTYAHDQLAAASEHEPSASLALYALGKTHLALARESREAEALHSPKAVTLLRASLTVDASNHLAANELGVLLAGYGQLAEARDALVHAVSLGGPVEAWHNLSVVHERLGENELARAAIAKWEAASRRARSGPAAEASTSGVRWVDAATFAHTSDAPTSNIFIPTGSAPVPAASGSASPSQGTRTGQQPWQGFRK